MVFAAGLFLWGMFRAVNRGDVVVHSWTTYAMPALAILAGFNSFMRSKRLANVVLAICGSFVSVLLVSAYLGPKEGGAYPIAAVVRAFVFFCLLAAAAWRQKELAAQQSAPADASQDYRVSRR